MAGMAGAALFTLMAKLSLDKGEFDSGLSEAESSGSSFASRLGSVLGTGMKAAGATVAAVGTAAVAAGKQIFSALEDISAAGDAVDKGSQKLGISAELYQKLGFAAEQSGTSIDSMSRGMMGITQTLANVASGVEGSTTAFDTLGVSLTNSDGSLKSTEQVLQETLFALADMEDTTQRNALAIEIFGRGASELSPLLNAGSDGIRDMMEQAEQYGLVMSDSAVSASAAFGDSLSLLQKSVQGVKTSLLSELLPGVTEIMNGFAGIVAGVQGADQTLNSGVQSMVGSLTSMVPRAVSVIGSIASAVLSAAPDIITSLADGITQAIPQLAPLAGNMISTLIEALTTVIPNLLQSGIQIIVSLVQGIASAIPQIVSAIPDIILSIVDTLADNSDEIVMAGIDIIIALAKGLIEAIPQLVEKLPQIIAKIVEGLLNGVSALMDVGKKLIEGLWEGIQASAEWLWDKLTGWVDNVFGFIKGLFGIKSPSTKMRDQVGKNIALGIAEGIMAGLGDVERASDHLYDAFPSVASGEYRLNVKRTISDAYSQNNQQMADMILDGLAQQTFIIQMDGREFGRAVRGVVAGAHA